MSAQSSAHGVSAWESFADRVIGDAAPPAGELRRRARGCVLGSLGMSAMLGIVAAVRPLVSTQPAALHNAGLLGALLCLLAPWLLRFTRSLTVAGSIPPLVVTALLGVSAHVEGEGLASPMMFAVPLVPGLAFAFLGLSGMYAFGALVVLQALIVVLLPRLGFPRSAPTYSANALEEMQLAGIFMATGLLVLVSAAQERQRRLAEERLQASEARHRALLEAVPDLMMRLDRSGAAIDVHEGDGGALLPPGRHLVGARSVLDMMPEPLASALLSDLQRTLHSGQLTLRELDVETVDGPKVFELRQMPSGADEVTVIFRDVTARRQQEQELERRAQHDSLTGLANRRRLRDALDEAIQRARKQGHAFALLFVDLDRFKQVNDALGHAVGDAVLAEVGARLARIVRDEDLAARHGGDEFTLLIDRVLDERAPEEVAHRVVWALTRPMHVLGHEIEVGASVGFALYPLDATSSEALLRCADIAMYAAKGSGGDAIQRFHPRLDPPSSEERRL